MIELHPSSAATHRETPVHGSWQGAELLSWEVVTKRLLPKNATSVVWVSVKLSSTRIGGPKLLIVPHRPWELTSVRVADDPLGAVAKHCAVSQVWPASPRLPDTSRLNRLP